MHLPHPWFPFVKKCWKNIDMKRFALVAASLLCCAALSGKITPEKSIPASDSRITYIGRTLIQGDSVSFDWSGVYARVSFTGGYLALRAGDTNCNYYNVWIDKGMGETPDLVVKIDRPDTLLMLFNAPEKKPRAHKAIIQKRSEGEQGTTTFREFTARGIFSDADPLKPRVIEAVGDSYTCGYGSESDSRNDPFIVAEENANLTYEFYLARYFDADCFVVAHSGRGIARNYGDAVPGEWMPDLYLRVFDKDPEYLYKPSVKPAITTVYLGTNDFSVDKQPSKRSFVRNYIKLISEIKANYGENHPVLCIAPMHDRLHEDYIRSAADECGFPEVYFVGFDPRLHDWDGDLGAAWHPNRHGHRKIALALLPYISTITGWPLEDKVL